MDWRELRKWSWVKWRGGKDERKESEEMQCCGQERGRWRSRKREREILRGSWKNRKSNCRSLQQQMSEEKRWDKETFDLGTGKKEDGKHEWENGEKRQVRRRRQMIWRNKEKNQKRRKDGRFSTDTTPQRKGHLVALIHEMTWWINSRGSKLNTVWVCLYFLTISTGGLTGLPSPLGVPVINPHQLHLLLVKLLTCRGGGGGGGSHVSRTWTDHEPSLTLQLLTHGPEYLRVQCSCTNFRNGRSCWDECVGIRG